MRPAYRAVGAATILAPLEHAPVVPATLLLPALWQPASLFTYAGYCPAYLHQYARHPSPDVGGPSRTYPDAHLVVLRRVSPQHMYCTPCSW